MEWRSNVPLELAVSLLRVLHEFVRSRMFSIKIVLLHIVDFFSVRFGSAL